VAALLRAAAPGKRSAPRNISPGEHVLLDAERPLEQRAVRRFCAAPVGEPAENAGSSFHLSHGFPVAAPPYAVLAERGQPGALAAHKLPGRDHPVAVAGRRLHGHSKTDLAVVNSGSNDVSILLGNVNGALTEGEKGSTALQRARAEVVQ
jgi:hypothetical protein